MKGASEMNTSLYSSYLQALTKPFQKLTKLEFLQPDDSVAFVLDNRAHRSLQSRYDSRAFIQGGTLNISFQNGQRRKANITLSNLDEAFSYSVNNLWFGSRLRLSMGLLLPNGMPFYLPQGIFYLNQPNNTISPSQRTISYSLVDKWAALDGTVFGTLPASYTVEPGANIFEAMGKVLQLDRTTMLSATQDPLKMIDQVPPVFTSYYNGLQPYQYEFKKPSGEVVQKTVNPLETAFTSTVALGGKAADIILELNKNLVGIVGYDQTGRFRLEASSSDISDAQKPLLWTFTKENGTLCGFVEAVKNGEVYNHVVVVGEGMNDKPVYGEAFNLDPFSDTNINLIGIKTFKQDDASYWNETQCISQAEWLLKRKTILQKSITFETTQMFHLYENALVAIKRFDKEGSPVERHLIQSISIPIGETGTMKVTAVNVNDFPNYSTQTASSVAASAAI